MTGDLNAPCLHSQQHSMKFLLVLVTWMLLCCRDCQAVDASEITVLWTEKYLLGEVRIMGVAGDPDVWLKSPGEVKPRAQTSPSSNFAKYQSYRVGLGFRYNTQDLFFSDRGFKEIFVLHLQNITHDSTYTYNVTLESVYTGTSENVYGLAVDWLSGTLYWTDSTYNTIFVASLDSHSVYDYLIVDTEKPMGIAVHPVKGYLFWTDYGSKPRLERARLDGTQRVTIYSAGMQQPLGMSIDTVQNLIYWVDDKRDTVEWVGLDGENHGQFKVPHTAGANPFHTLFSCAVYRDYVFVTDQYSMSIRAFNRSDNMAHIKDVFTNLAIPYDIMVWAGDTQPQGTSVCGTSLKCQHLCLSLGEGRGRCSCKHGYTLQPDGISCEAEPFAKPIYIYTIGKQLCATKINFVDRNRVAAGVDVNCFLEDLSHVEAMAFDVYGEMLFFSDTDDRSIYRMSMITEELKPEVIVANTGQVRGIAVDYIANNIYWTDEELGHIMVSKLDGSHASVLLDSLDQPRGIAVDPFEKKLYWASPGAIYQCGLDGSNVGQFATGDVRNPDGMVLDLRTKKLFWTDPGSQTISVKNTTGGPVKNIFAATKDSKNFRDVTVFQDYITWTDGANGVFFGRLNKNDKGIKRAYNHPDMNVSHDIITYGDYLQPLLDAGHGGDCDAVDNGGCEHLCLPTTVPMSDEKYRKCVCSVGFYLDTDKKGCVSDLVDENFVMFVDPYSNTAYQLDFTKPNPEVQGMHMETAQLPMLLDYDETQEAMYWFDELMQVIRRDTLDIAGKGKKHREQTVTVVNHDVKLTAMRVHGESQRLFFTNSKNGFYVVDLQAPRLYAKLFYQSRDTVYPDTLNIYPQEQSLFWLEKDRAATFLTKMGMEGRQPMIHITNIPYVPDIAGMELDHHARHIYIWNATHVYRCNLDGSDWRQVMTWTDGQLLSLAVLGDNMYFSDYNRRALFYKKLGSAVPAVPITQDVFSRIQHVISYSPFSAPVPPTNPYKPKPTTPSGGKGQPTKPSGGKGENTGNEVNNINGGKNAASTSDDDNGQLYIIVGAVAGGILLLVIILVVAFIVIRRRKKDKAPDSVHYTAEAHDNPTYMKHTDVQRDPGLVGLPADLTVGAEGQAAPLPEKKMMPGMMPESGPDPYADIVGPAVGELAPPDEHYEVPDTLDVQKLVDSSYDDNNDIVVCVDEQNGSVAFKSDN